MTLYSIDGEIRFVLSQTNEETGEITPEQLIALDALDLDRARAVESLTGWILEGRAEVEATKSEAKRLADLARIRANRVERIEEYLLTSMKAHDENKFDFPTARVTIAATPPGVRQCPDDPMELPEQFRRVAVTVNKSELVAAWKRGEPIPASVIVAPGETLRIK